MAGDLEKQPVEGAPQEDATRLCELERIEQNLFRNRFSEMDRNDHLFGGQVLAQSLAAAMATVEGHQIHSLHGYFLRAGSASQRVTFTVERSRDGSRFVTRRVVAQQSGLPIFHLQCSFHIAEPGFDHQEAMPLDVPPPESLPDLPTVSSMIGSKPAERSGLLIRSFPLMEIRLVDYKQLLRQDIPARRRLWLRVPSASGCNDPLVHQQLLAYLSDYWLASSTLVPHPIHMAGPNLFIASLDHALWFHNSHRVDEWLLYDCDSPYAGHGRGLSRGLLYDRHGRLIASVAQEALLRRT